MMYILMHVKHGYGELTGDQIPLYDYIADIVSNKYGCINPFRLDALQSYDLSIDFSEILVSDFSLYNAGQAGAIVKKVNEIVEHHKDGWAWDIDAIVEKIGKKVYRNDVLISDYLFSKRLAKVKNIYLLWAGVMGTQYV